MKIESELKKGPYLQARGRRSGVCVSCAYLNHQLTFLFPVLPIVDRSPSKILSGFIVEGLLRDEVSTDVGDFHCIFGPEKFK